MGNMRGLRTRLCPKCTEVTPHRTLYAKTQSGGRTKWFQLFWACSRCGMLNHIILPRYRLESASSQLPSNLTTGVVNALAEGPLDFDELIAGLKQRRVPGVRHIFNSEVAMALEYLKGRGVVDEENGDRTERTLDFLRLKAESKHLGPCPAELSQGVARTTLISLYAQRRKRIANDQHSPSRELMRLVPVGVLCLSCRYCRIDSELFRTLPSGGETPIPKPS